MRIVIAARLSQLADGQTGLDTQDAESTAYAVANGHTIVHVAADHKSGTSAPWDRPNLKPWVTEAGKLAQYDAVLAYRLDRLSRGDNVSTNAIEAWAHDNHKTLLTVDGLHFPCEGVDGIRWDVTKRIAHDEWLKTSERYSRMQAHLRSQGKLTGRPPFGYAVAPAFGGHKMLVPTDEGRAYVPEIFARVIAGDSLNTVGRWLKSEGVKPTSGKGWHARSIGLLVRCPTYMGRRSDAAGCTILKCEPLVDAVTFRRAGEALDARPKRGPVVEENRALLSGVLFCARCEDSPMYRVMCGAEGNRRPYYRCTGRGADRHGCGNMVPVADLDGQVDELMSNAHFPIMEERLIPGHDYSARLEEIRFETRELAARDLADDVYDAELARLRAERDELRSRPSVPDRVEQIDTGTTYAERWAAQSDAERGGWLRSMGVRILAERGAQPDLRTVARPMVGEWLAA